MTAALMIITSFLDHSNNIKFYIYVVKNIQRTLYAFNLFEFKNTSSLLKKTVCANFFFIYDIADNLISSIFIIITFFIFIFFFVSILGCFLSTNYLSFFVFIELIYATAILHFFLKIFFVMTSLIPIVWIFIIFGISGVEAAIVFVLLASYFSFFNNLTILETKSFSSL